MDVEANGVRLWVERFGDPGHPVVLLVSGADSPCARWTPAFVDPLVAGGYQVIRYDIRDVGRSEFTDPAAPYRLDDLAADASGVLDAIGAERAHVVGRSMGGMIGQLLALDHPGRVWSLTLISTTPGLGDDRLSTAHDAIVDALAARLFHRPPPEAEDDRVEWVVDGYRIFTGPGYPFEEVVQRALAEAEVAVAWRPETGHGLAVNASPSRFDRLGQISAPTMVIHGTADGVFPPDHAEALGAGIPNSELWLIEGLGHELPDALAPDLTTRLLAFFPTS